MEKETYVTYLFVSRNKDNKSLVNFKQRSKSFVSHKSPEKILPAFEKFINEGIEGEFSRMYFSINERDCEKTMQDLVVYLIQHPDFDLSKIQSLVASLADAKKNAASSLWLFDYDSTENLSSFLSEIPEGIDTTKVAKTVNGYAVIVEHGFDTRKILADFPCVTLKRDAKLCFLWGKKK